MSFFGKLYGMVAPPTIEVPDEPESSARVNEAFAKAARVQYDLLKELRGKEAVDHMLQRVLGLPSAPIHGG